MEDIERSKPLVERASLDLSAGSVADLERLIGTAGPKAVHAPVEGGEIRGLALSAGGGAAVFAPFDHLLPKLQAWLADPARPKWVHAGKELQTTLLAGGMRLAGVAFDAELAGYLLDPAEASYPLSALSQRYLGLDVTTEESEGEGQLFADPSRPAGLT